MGQSQMFERLVALDDESHTLKWRLISHPESVSPFGEASWVNFFAAFTLKEITHSNHTFVEWKGGPLLCCVMISAFDADEILNIEHCICAGEFFTERHFATEMHATLERWFQSGLLSLKVMAVPYPLLAWAGNGTSSTAGKLILSVETMQCRRLWPFNKETLFHPQLGG